MFSDLLSDWEGRTLLGIMAVILFGTIALIIWLCVGGADCPTGMHDVQRGFITEPVLVGKIIVIEQVPNDVCVRNSQ